VPTVLDRKLAEAHGLAIAASTLSRRLDEQLTDWDARSVLEELARDADEIRRRCGELGRSAGPEQADELRALANTTHEHVADLVAAWFKAGTDQLQAWTFVMMVEAAELALWTALASMDAPEPTRSLVARALEIQQRHTELVRGVVPRLARATDRDEARRS